MYLFYSSGLRQRLSEEDLDSSVQHVFLIKEFSSLFLQLPYTVHDFIILYVLCFQLNPLYCFFFQIVSSVRIDCAFLFPHQLTPICYIIFRQQKKMKIIVYIYIYVAFFTFLFELYIYVAFAQQ